MARLIRWLPLGLAVTLICGVLYAALLQSARQQANDPQVQLAEDIGAAVASGVAPKDAVPQNVVSLTSSLAPFAMVYDEKNTLLASSARLMGGVPLPPEGVLDGARQQGVNRVTWEPRNGVREAVVAIHFVGKTSGVVVAGRSLREVEKRVSALRDTVFSGWVATCAVTLVASLLTWRDRA